jgi:hypothetical protein
LWAGVAGGTHQQSHEVKKPLIKAVQSQERKLAKPSRRHLEDRTFQVIYMVLPDFADDICSMIEV